MSVITEYIQHPLLKDCALDNGRNHVQYTMLGGQDYSITAISDTSASENTPNNSNCNFIYKPPNVAVVDREFLIEVKVRTTLSAGTYGNNFAPKQWPVARMMDTLNVQVNNNVIQSTPSNYADILGRHKTSQEYFKKYRSMTPCEPDAFNRYENYAIGSSYAGIDAGSQAFITAGVGVPGGSARTDVNNTEVNQIWDCSYSPFINGYSATDDNMPRGRFPYEISSAGDAERIYTFTEPLLSPFCMPRQGHGAAHLTDLEVKATWASNLERAFSSIKSVGKPSFRKRSQPGDFIVTWTNVDAGTGNDAKQEQAITAQAGGNLTVDIVGVRLIVKSIIPTMDIPIAPKCDISFNQLYFAKKTLGAITTNKTSASFPITRLSCVPSHIFIWGKPVLTSQTRYMADAFLKFDSINITLGGKSGLLNNFTQQDLYLMSTENGMNISFPQFIQTVGSPLCVALGKDILGIKPGLADQVDFSFDATVTNTTYFDHSFRAPQELVAAQAGHFIDQSIQWDLCCLFVYPTTLTLAPGGYSAQSVGFRDSEIEESKGDGPSVYDHEEGQEPVGGSLGSWLRRNYKKAHHLVKRHIRPLANAAQAASMYVPQLKPVAGVIDSAATAMGQGLHPRTRGRGFLKN